MYKNIKEDWCDMLKMDFWDKTYNITDGIWYYHFSLESIGGTLYHENEMVDFAIMCIADLFDDEAEVSYILWDDRYKKYEIMISGSINKEIIDLFSLDDMYITVPMNYRDIVNKNLTEEYGKLIKAEQIIYNDMGEE